MKLELPIVFIDIESTGVDPVKDRIVEFGATILSPEGERRDFCQRFNPIIPIPAVATEVHHISDEDVKDCPTFDLFAGKIHRALAGKDLAGYNLWRLDLPILDEEFRRYGFKLDLTGVRVIDCFGIFSKRDPRKLEDAVRKYCGRDHDGSHGALPDARATSDVFLGQMKAYPDLDAMDLDGVASYSRISDQPYVDLAGKLYRDPDGDVCYAFGKYKGSKVIDVPDYADWMLSRDFPGSTCEALLAELKRLDSEEQALPL